MRTAVLSIAIVGMLAGAVFAQGGEIGLYEDQAGTDCDIEDAGGQQHWIYVVHKIDEPARASVFKVSVDPNLTMTYMGYTLYHSVYYGDPLTGITVAYDQCSSSDVLVLSLLYYGYGTSPDCSYLNVVPDPASSHGQIEVLDCADNIHYAKGRLLRVNPNIYCPCDLLTKPIIQSVEDVGNDQGRQVRLVWTRSTYDVSGSATVITGYDVYRRQKTGLTSERQATDRDDTGTISKSAQILGWDYLGTHPANGFKYYQMVVPTLCDSTADGGICWSEFMVCAMSSDPHSFFFSDPDSGYSVDNLAPFAPSVFTVVYNTGSGNQLSWDENLEEDLQYYNVYRGTTEGFIPSPANRVHSTTDTDWTDPDYDGWPVYYKITAVDFAGNESEDSSPETSVGADETVPGMTTLSQNVPNPFNPTTTISFSTAAAGRVTLSIFDASGQHVKTLVDENVSAGVRSVVWDGRDAAGTPVSSGIYFYRLTTNTTAHTKKMLLLK